MASHTILLVEDNPFDIDLTRRAFERSRIANNIVVAEDGEEALELLLGSEGDVDPVLPQVVIVDLKLPKVSGLEVLEALRNNPRTELLPVVVLTSSDEQRDMIETYKHGANSYIRKPVDSEQFARAIEHLGLYWIVLNRTPE